LGGRSSFPIGIVYSTVGAYSALSRHALEGAHLAVETVNTDPSFGFALTAHYADPEGVADRYPALAGQLMREACCQHIVGAITSWSRKELLPVVERHEGLLWYAFPYEGYETNEQVIYLGACPNQHIVPLLDYVAPRFGLRPFLVASNYVWGWEISRIARELVTAAGGQVCGECYIPLGNLAVEHAIAEIRLARPDFILCNLLGPSTGAFLRAYAKLGQIDPGFAPDCRPVASCNMTEIDLADLGEAAAGHLATAVYFDTLGTRAADALRRHAHKHGATQRFTSAFAATYTAVIILAESIRDAGSDEPVAVRTAATRRSFDTPLGAITVDARTLHATLTPHIGRATADRRFLIIDTAPAPIPADPYLVQLPKRTIARLRRARMACDPGSNSAGLR
jgi:ABC-type branched-subunit amino acid transport system substrate-binding protein